MEENIALFAKSKFLKAQLILFFLPVCNPRVLLVKDGYASTHISIYISHEIIAVYTSHRKIEFLSLWKQNEMKLQNISLGNTEENWMLCLKSIAIISHTNSCCQRKPSAILLQSLSVIPGSPQRRGSLERRNPTGLENRRPLQATHSTSLCLNTLLSLKTTPSATQPQKDALLCPSGTQTLFFVPSTVQSKMNWAFQKVKHKAHYTRFPFHYCRFLCGH